MPEPTSSDAPLAGPTAILTGAGSDVGRARPPALSAAGAAVRAVPCRGVLPELSAAPGRSSRPRPAGSSA